MRIKPRQDSNDRRAPMFKEPRAQIAAIFFQYAQRINRAGQVLSLKRMKSFEALYAPQPHELSPGSNANLLQSVQHIRHRSAFVPRGNQFFDFVAETVDCVRKIRRQSLLLLVQLREKHLPRKLVEIVKLLLGVTKQLLAPLHLQQNTAVPNERTTVGTYSLGAMSILRIRRLQRKIVDFRCWHDTAIALRRPRPRPISSNTS